MVKWVLLGAALLVALNVPGPVSHQVKTAMREGMAPLQGLLTSAAKRLRETGRAIKGFGGIAAENRRLRQEVVRLRTKLHALSRMQAENEELRALLEFRERSSRNLIPAEVIARNISGWWQTVRLNKGEGHGISRDAAVLTAQGLVGRTISTSPKTSDVLLLSDPACRVAVMVSRPGAFGILSGRGVDASGDVLLELNFLNKDREIREGDMVVTSGLGGIFPRGLLVGYVQQAEIDDSGLYQRAVVLPKADLGGLTTAFVIAPQPDDPARDLLLRRRANPREVRP